MRTIVWAIFFGVTVASNLHAQREINRLTKLTEKNFSSILNSIARKTPDQQWEEIPWRPSFQDALVEARRTDKPVLLWMMNGHPCGMT